MSAEPEYEVQTGSRIKLTRNAKGDCQIEVSVREGSTTEELDRMRALAVAQYRTIETEFYGARS